MRAWCKKLLWLAAALTTVTLGLLLFILIPPASPPPTPLPNPNGHSTLVSATRQLSGNFSAYRDLNPEALQSLLNDNSNALHLARTGLTQEFRMPPVYSQGALGTRVVEFPALKNLAYAFAAEARLAQTDHKPGKAADSLLNAIQLGINCAHGGVLIDAMFAIALESIAARDLELLVHQVNAQDCRRIAAALESYDAGRSAWEDVLDEERRFTHRAFSLQERIVGFFSESTKAQESAEQKFRRRQAATRQLILAFAARAYELEKGKPPGSPADLVPDYLKAVPLDPVGGTNLTLAP